MEESRLLDDWNYELRNQLIANDVFLALYIIIGISGNSLVILVYNLKLSNKKEDRYFIPVLATMDLLACLVGSSYALALNLLPAKFTNNVLCKLLWYLSESTTIASALLLVVIAVQRYLKVCKPLITFSLWWKRVAILLCFVLSSISSIPTLFLYGELKFPHEKYNITGSRCGQLDDNDPVFRRAVISYTTLEFILAVAGCVSFTVLYALVGRQVYKKFIIFKRKLTLRRRPLGKYTPNGKSAADMAEKNISVTSADFEISNSSIEDESNDKNSNPKRRKRRSIDMLQENVSAMKKHFHKHRYTYMFMAITLVFVISFTPRITIMLIESIYRDFWKHLASHPKTLSVCYFFYRFYIFNHIINPFIYGFFDTTFRIEVKRLFLKQPDRRTSETEF